VAAPAVASTAVPTAAAEERAARKELARLERQLGRLTQREAALQQRIAEQTADPAVFSTTTFHELDAELRAVLTEKSALEDRWLELADVVYPPVS
ncbi:MAG: hypothetical protein LC808_09150, partial [Actinobacteria bacterium]|nr:hypothetical protein [Actinomycetota bacterium]